jgi:hypothetical protein
MTSETTAGGFTHYAIVADGRIVEANAEFGTEPGPAVISMKAWASNTEEAVDMIVEVSNRFGFKLAGEIEIYVTAPDAEAKDHPFGYDVGFSRYDDGGRSLN